MAAALILGKVFVRMEFTKEQARGSILVISFARKEVCSPRTGKMWPFARIVRWDIVYGAWVRKSYNGKPMPCPDIISELQMVFENDNKEQSAWPVIGVMGRDHRLFTVARRIAKRMDLPLYFIKQEKGHKLITTVLENGRKDQEKIVTD